MTAALEINKLKKFKCDAGSGNCLFWDHRKADS